MSSRSGKLSWSPYTEEEEANTTPARASRAASRTLSVPRTLTSVVRLGLSDRTRNRSHRPLVEDDVAPLSGGPHRVLIAQVGLHEPHVGHVRQVLDLAVRQVVQAHDLVSVRDEPTAQMRADEPGGAGHEHPRGRQCMWP